MGGSKPFTRQAQPFMKRAGAARVICRFLNQIYQTHYCMRIQNLLSLLLLLISVLSLPVALISCGDDEDPVSITVTDFETTLDENPTLGKVVGQIAATTNRGSMVFAVVNTGTFNDAFTIDAATGELRVAEPDYFDYESNTIVTGKVTITNEGITRDVAVKVNVKNVSEVTVDNFSVTVLENVEQGVFLGTISASTTNEGLLTYSLTNMNPTNALVIDANGVLRVSDPARFNYELYPTITATVRVATYNGTDYAEASITVTLTDQTETVQERLDDGETPLQIYTKSNSLLNQLYAKNYAGGIIGAFNTSTGSCLILSGNQGGSYTASAAVTAANNLVLNSYDDWRLPTEAEANSLNTALSTGTNVLPTGGYYWTSTGCGGICVRDFFIGSSGIGGGGAPANNSYALMAIRIQN